MEIVTVSTTTTPGSAMKIEAIARNVDNHAPWLAIIGSVGIHIASVLFMRFGHSGKDYVAPEKPKVVKVRILANPHGNPAVTQTKAVEIAKPKPIPKPNARNITKKTEPKVEEPQPETNSAPQSFGDDPTGGVVGVGVSTSTGDSDPGVTSNWQPLEQTKPSMPKEAALKGIEGWIKFRVDINEEGRPENITVVEAENRSVFENEARKALRKWKYAPRMVNGQAVKVIGHLITIEFKLTD
ncbi:MAG: TonB family protein [Proteobacteria bacterium]|nr:TonB family protein [Pseudomonadota bacterium]